MLLTANDIRGVYSIIPTPYKPVQGVWQGEDTVDHVETERLVNAIIEDGSNGLMALGTTGEGSTVTEAEYRSFTATVLKAARRRVPVFIGATCMGLHQTIERLRYARDLGADGTLLGLPMWQECTEDIAVNFYAAVSKALPDMAIMVYANKDAFRFDFPPSFWAKVVDRAPTVTSAKFMNIRTYLDCLKAVRGKVNLLPFPETVAEYVKLAPESVTALWATSASMGPQVIVKMMDALKRRDMDLFEKIAADLKWSGQPIMKPDGIIPSGRFGSYNIQFEKLRFEASGYCRPGPGRPPYDTMPENFAEDARENARRWVEVNKRYMSL